MNIVNYFKNRRREKQRKDYERQMSDLRAEASRVITIRNVEFVSENKVRPCILINGVIAYVSYEDDSNDIMGMMLHLRERYVELFQAMPLIKLL